MKFVTSSQSGQLTFDFITALLLTFGLGTILMAMGFTLSVVEVAQYAAYSAARTMSAASVSEQVQIESARTKLKELTTTGRIGGLFSVGWFELGNPEIRAGNGNTFRAEFEPTTPTQPRRNFFVGLSIPLKSRILEINLPLIGKTGEEGAFATNINAFMLREPSQDECFKFFEARKAALRALESAQQYYEPTAMVRTEDNGC